ncbi:MAG: SDR family NAD(P)-dependent oxidoreductase [Candidatus Berkiellales bacterium]
MKIQGSVALVVGGASGLGKAVCHALAHEGAVVIVMDQAAEKANQVAKEIGGVAICCDISKANTLEDAFSQIEKKITLPITIVINCAGILRSKRMVGKSGPMPLSLFEEIIQVNLIGTFNVMRLAAAQIIKATGQEGERGVIINTASIAAFEGQIGQTAYSASKGGIVAMTLPAARELAQFGIRVMTIAPGLIDTPMISSLSPELQNSLKDQMVFPKRFGLPSEFASLVIEIITNPLLNGEIIRLDGGLRMR